MVVLEHHSSVSVHLVEFEVPFVNVTVVPRELSCSLHLTVDEWTFVLSEFSLHGFTLFVVFVKYSFVLSLVLLKDTCSVHVSVFEAAFVLSAVFPFHFSFSVFESVDEVAFVLSDAWEDLYSLSVWLSILPLTFVSHFIDFVEEFSFSVENTILELAIVIRSIWINVETPSIGFTISKIGL